MLNRRTCLKLAATGLLTSSLAARRAVAADGKVVRLVVGSAPGGPADVQARALAESMRKAGGALAIVDNRPGAAGRLAVQAMKSLTPDTTHLLVAPGWLLTLAPQTDRSPLFDPFVDLLPIGGYCIQEYALVVGPGTPAKSLAEFIAWVKSRPEGGQYGSAGVGSMGHLVGNMLERSAGVSLQSIPYKGATPALQDVQAGHVASYIGALGDMVRMHREGTARVLATSGIKRSKFLPDVPTFEEAGFAGVKAVDWTALFAPVKTAPAILQSCARLLESCSKDKDFVALLDKVGVEASFMNATDLAARMKADTNVMREHVKAFNLKGST